MIMKKTGKAVVMIVMMLAIVLVGCGSKEVVWKEFTSQDGTVSISMNEEWQLEDIGAGSEGWVAAFTEDGSEGILVMQAAKSIFGANIVGMDDWKALIESSYPMSEMEEIDNPTISGMDISGTYSCVVTAEGVKGAGRILYGETEYAYYSILYVAPKIDSAKAEYYNNVCTSFKETAN